VSVLALQYRDAGDSAGDSSAAGDRPDAR